jgi:hypothetical protein
MRNTTTLLLTGALFLSVNAAIAGDIFAPLRNAPTGLADPSTGWALCPAALVEDSPANPCDLWGGPGECPCVRVEAPKGGETGKAANARNDAGDPPIIIADKKHKVRILDYSKPDTDNHEPRILDYSTPDQDTHEVRILDYSSDKDESLVRGKEAYRTQATSATAGASDPAAHKRKKVNLAQINQCMQIVDAQRDSDIKDMYWFKIHNSCNMPIKAFWKSSLDVKFIDMLADIQAGQDSEKSWTTMHGGQAFRVKGIACPLTHSNGDVYFDHVRNQCWAWD